MGRLALIFTGLLLVSCASGGDDDTGGSNDDVDTFPDASHAIIDAAPRIDAPTQTLPDGGLEGFLCEHNTDCLEPGTCCIPLFMICAPGEIVLGDICNPF